MASHNKDTLFKAPRRAEDKWEQSNSVSRAMMDAEAAERKKKTDRLRKLRLEAEGGEPEEAPSADTPASRRRTAVQGAKRSLAIKDE